MIKSKEDSYTDKILQGWGGDINSDDRSETGIPVILGETGTSNQFDDNGTVLTFESEASGWSSSSNEMPSFERMLKKMKRLMTNNISENEIQQLQEVLQGKSLEDEDEGDES